MELFFLLQETQKTYEIQNFKIPLKKVEFRKFTSRGKILNFTTLRDIKFKKLAKRKGSNLSFRKMIVLIILKKEGNEST